MMSIIKRKKKICSVCGTEQYLFGKGMCARCYPKKVLKKKKKDKPAFGFSSQLELFSYLWDNSDKKCWLSGEHLMSFEGNTRWFSCFAHVLAKGKYPKYKLNPDNIRIIHPDAHYLLDMGTQEQRDRSRFNFDKWFELKNKLKNDYDTQT